MFVGCQGRSRALLSAWPLGEVGRELDYVALSVMPLRPGWWVQDRPGLGHHKTSPDKIPT